MANFFTDNPDLQYYVEKGIDWETLVNAVEQSLPNDDIESVEDAVYFYKEVLNMVGEFVANEVAPRAAAIDHEGPWLEDGQVKHPKGFDEIFEHIKSLELHGLGVPRELGGMNAPHILNLMCSEMFARADVSMMTHHSFHFGIAMALLVYSMNEGTTEYDPETGAILSTRFETEIRDILSGEAWGAMDITEPDAGSDMAALSTKAFQDDDGNWFITGQKIFITSGHGKYHIVIARSEADKEGLDALSTFMVQTYEDLDDGTRKRYATIDRLEEKLGHHASPTCSVIFENSPAKLIGNRGEGFKQMLLLMNNARLGVGFESVAVCQASYVLAKEYAAERRAFGKTIDKHEMIADYLDDMESTIAGLRAMGYTATFHEEMGFRIGIQLSRDNSLSEIDRKRLERRQRKHKAASRKITPLFKYLAAEKAVEMARMCMQIHGGAGYTTEYGAEKLLRDALVMPIYEGTSQIQSLMAMKDTLGAIMKNPQEFVRRLAQARWKTMSGDSLARRVAKIEHASLTAQQHLVRKTAMDKFQDVRHRPMGEWLDLLRTDWDPKRDFAFAMLHAENLALLLSDEAIVGILYEQAQKHPERREVLEAYLERAEVRSRMLVDKITNTGDRLLGRLAKESEAAAE